MIITITAREIERVWQCVDSLRRADCFHLVCRHFVDGLCHKCPLREPCGHMKTLMLSSEWERIADEIAAVQLKAQQHGDFLLIDTDARHTGQSGDIPSQD